MIENGEFVYRPDEPIYDFCWATSSATRVGHLVSTALLDQNQALYARCGTGLPEGADDSDPMYRCAKCERLVKHPAVHVVDY